MMLQLRPYQQDCIAAIEAQPPGAYLVQMATGLGNEWSIWEDFVT